MKNDAHRVKAIWQITEKLRDADDFYFAIIVDTPEAGGAAPDLSYVQTVDNDAFGIRPASVAVVLTGSVEGTSYSETYSCTLSGTAGTRPTGTDPASYESAAWTATFVNLPKKHEGAPITYTASEPTVPAGYTAAVTGSMTDGFTITNTPETVDVEVNAVWASAASFQPESVTVELLANGLPVDPAKTAVLSGENSWKKTWTGLAKYAKNGDTVSPITYAARENPEPVSYEVSCSSADGSNGGIILTVTNTPQTVDIPVTKVWNDNNNEYGLRPASLTVMLYQQIGKGEKTLADTQTLTSDSTPAWSYRWTGLPQYGLNGSEKAQITYTVEEGTAPAGYTAEVNGYTITNTFKPVETDPPVAKVIEGDAPDQDEMFTFTLTAIETSVEGMTPAAMPLPEGAENGVMTMTITGAGSMDFGKFFFTRLGTYKYEIREVNDGREGYTYDTHVYTIEFSITVNDKDNSLVKTMTVDGEAVDEFADGQFTFVNTYKKEVTPPPETGDNSRALLNAVIVVLSVAGIAFILKKKKEKTEAE